MMPVCRFILTCACIFISSLLHGRGDRLYIPDLGRNVKPRMTVIASEQRSGYSCSLVEFTVERRERIKAYLLVPDGASAKKVRPAVLMLHDHGARCDIGKEKLVKPMASVLEGREHIINSSRQWVDKYFEGVHVADLFAASGYVVLVADALYWGDRSSADAQRWSMLNYAPDADPAASKDQIKSLKEKVYEGQRNVYDSLSRKKIIWAEKILRDDIASACLLKSLPYVDSENIGAFGFSMGAHRCWMLSAFCEEVKCGAALSWMTSLKDYKSDHASDLSMRIQPMRDRMDFGDIGLFLRPKPMLFINGEKDHLFSKEMADIAFDKLHLHYSAYPDERANLRTLFFDGGHHCPFAAQYVILEFFDEILK